jgi:hypothetical protein
VLLTGGLLLDTMESYTNGAALNGLNQGTGWCKTASYVDRTNYVGIVSLDTMESYTTGTELIPLSGGTGWPASYAGDNALPSIPATMLSFVGETVTITATITGTGIPPLSYQWKKNGIALSNAGEYSGVTTLTLTITGYASGDDGTYTFEATDNISRIFASNGCVATSNTRGADWAARVQTNGGAAPAAGTVTAINTFWSAVISAGIVGKIKYLNIIAPDSLIASYTPLVVGIGLDPWVKKVVGTGAGESLTVNGLLSSASTTNGNAYDTGVTPSAVSSFNTGNGGLCVYVSDPVPTNTPNSIVGSFDGTSTGFLIVAYDGGVARSYLWFSSISAVGAHTQVGGFYVSSRTATNVHNIYFANSSVAWASLGSNSSVNSNVPLANKVAAGGALSTATYGCCPQRISIVGIIDGLTTTQGQALYNAVQALRTSFGGGFV